MDCKKLNHCPPKNLIVHSQRTISYRVESFNEESVNIMIVFLKAIVTDLNKNVKKKSKKIIFFCFNLDDWVVDVSE